MNTRDAQVRDWIEAKKLLDLAKVNEILLRQMVLEHCSDQMGTTVSLIGDVELKVTRGVTVQVDEAVLEEISKDLNTLESACIKYKPVLKQALFNALPEGSILLKAITTKPSQPSVKVIEGKS
ncbi:MAG: hypothetical protein DRP42_04460 [Tenericutes bacterium]|nr:MAG: hypothetical protein DRP42_04460 [Mycoplasmatota bacterium]